MMILFIGINDSDKQLPLHSLKRKVGFIFYFNAALILHVYRFDMYNPRTDWKYILMMSL
jgi:hypothetical protein